MHPLHDYMETQLADKIKSRRVVVWYDERGEFAPFVSEVRGGPRVDGGLSTVSVGGLSVKLAEYAGSMFELRAAVEPHVSRDVPDAVVIYMPGCARDRHASVLMELEKAGTSWEPQLKQLAKNVLLQKYTLGVVDEILRLDRNVSYEDLARAAEGGAGSEPPSILKSIFHDASGTDGLLAAWLTSDARDEELAAKEANRELCKLIRSRLELELSEELGLSKMRSIVARYVLANEFRSDLTGDPPPHLSAIAKPKTNAGEAAVRELAQRLRNSFPAEYITISDQTQDELRLPNATISAERLGSVDTFRFEERALLKYCGELIANSRFVEALKIITEREHSFWVDRDVARKTHWDACRFMANLGMIALQVHAVMRGSSMDAAAWIAAYVRDWHRLDQAQRHLEGRVRLLEDDPDERALAIVRREYEDACHAMAIGFVQAMDNAHWSVPAVLHQTHVFSDVVSIQPKPVAYFLVDAMRFEMGAELASTLPKTSEVSLRPAVVALPSITPIGMAALLPGASSSFNLADYKGELGARIDDTFLGDLPSRKKHVAARIPKSVDMTLDQLLAQTKGKLGKKIEGAQVIIVRSQEIDLVGESGLYQARLVMDSVIGNLARAIGKLARVGVERVVVSADHGHLFASDRDESMRIEAPGGATVDLHRRCWIGRGGTTPAGCTRVSASALGYASDLDLVFPVGCGVFKAGGDLAFHHGGPSLQEMIVPVLTALTKAPTAEQGDSGSVNVVDVPPAITNRIFTVTIRSGGSNLAMFAEPKVLRPVLITGDRQVGVVCTVIDGAFDATTGCVTVPPNVALTVAFILNDDSVSSLRIAIQDPTTDAELYRSPADIPIRLGV
jgi:hypothetical protein